MYKSKFRFYKEIEYYLILRFRFSIEEMECGKNVKKTDTVAIKRSAALIIHKNKKSQKKVVKYLPLSYNSL